MLNTKSDGQIITIDREQFKIDKATRNFEEAGVSSLIKIRKGEARKILHEIKEEFGKIILILFLLMQIRKVI